MKGVIFRPIKEDYLHNLSNRFSNYVIGKTRMNLLIYIGVIVYNYSIINNLYTFTIILDEYYKSC
jgi:hypothetical protein